MSSKKKLSREVPFAEVSKSKELSLASHYIEIGRYKQAKDILEDLLSENPNDGSILYLLASCYYFLEQYLDALELVQEALNKGFALENCNCLMGQIFVDTKKFIQAEECFLAALAINPRDAETIAAYGNLMIATGHEKKAIKLLEEALSIEPDNPIVLHYNLKIHFSKDKNRYHQIKFLEDYMESASSEVSKLIHLGLYHVLRKQHWTARQLFKEAFLLDPTSKHLQEILDEFHPIYMPLYFVEKIGGPAVLWIGMVLIFMISEYFDIYYIATPLAIIYIVFCIYSWVVPYIFKKYFR